jgi:hypothetical protein
MANYKTPQIVNRESSANAQQMNNPQYGGMSNVYFVAVQWLVNASVAATNTVELIRLPPSSRILQIWAKNESLGTTLTFSMGVFTSQTGLDPGDPSSPTCINSSNLAGQTARTSFTVVGNSGAVGGTKGVVANRLYELIGLDPAPAGELSLTLFVAASTTPTAGASMVFLCMVQAD